MVRERLRKAGVLGRPRVACYRFNKGGFTPRRPPYWEGLKVSLCFCINFAFPGGE